MATEATNTIDAPPGKRADLQAEILRYVETNDYVSFAELHQHLHECGHAADGDLAIVLDRDPNLILWTKMSDEFFAAVQSLYTEQRIFFWPFASAIVYTIDGQRLTLPIARRAPSGGYKKPHWLPVTLRTKPLDRTTRRSGK